MEQADLRDASDVMIEFAKRGGPIQSNTDTNDNTTTTIRYLLAGRSHISLSSGCELFLKYVTRASLETPGFQECKSQVLERGERFAEFSTNARGRIATVGSPFVREGSVVLTHGRSKVVEALLLRAALVEKKRFRVIVLEGRPDAGGAKSAKTYANAGIPATVVLDSAMGYIMERVDLVIVGAEGVVENGGTVNKVGTFALGVMAKELSVPLYVAAESYKFTRMYPLNNADYQKWGRVMGLVDRYDFWIPWPGVQMIVTSIIQRRKRRVLGPNEQPLIQVVCIHMWSTSLHLCLLRILHVTSPKSNISRCCLRTWEC